MLRPRSSALVSFAAAFAIMSPAAAQQVKLSPITAAQAQRLERLLDKTSLLDGATNLKVDPKQSFDLMSTVGEKQLTVVSVRFDIPNGGGISGPNCGVYLVQPNGTMNFFDPISEGIPIVCEGILAVRLRRDPATPPDFIFTAGFTSGSRAWQQRFSVSWDKVSGKYTLDSTEL